MATAARRVTLRRTPFAVVAASGAGSVPLQRDAIRLRQGIAAQAVGWDLSELRARLKAETVCSPPRLTESFGPNLPRQPGPTPASSVSCNIRATSNGKWRQLRGTSGH